MMSKEVGAADAPNGDNSADNQAVAAIITENADDSDTETPQSYNKLKYHSSKMDLNLRILREEMGNLQDSGNSLSRQIASMYRSFQEMKDEDEKGEEECSDYDQYSNDDIDSQCADGKDDDLDTEDDVNKMSDLETDYSSRSTASKRKKQQKRPPPLQLEPPGGNFESDPNGNEIRPYSPPADVVEDIDQAQNSDFYPDFETSSSEDCSHCLCCSSLASYSSGIPWKYVDKSASSAPEYDSDSSEYCTDSDDAPEASPMPLYKRLSPFFYQECYAEVEDEVPKKEESNIKKGVNDEDDEESVPEKRMSPLGCESPNPPNSRGSSQPDLDEKCYQRPRNNKSVTKRNDQSVLHTRDAHKPFNSESAKIPKGKEEFPQTGNAKEAIGITIGIKDKQIKSKFQPLLEKPTESTTTRSKVSAEKNRKSDVESSTSTSDDESDSKTNVKDRIKNFEAHSMENNTEPLKRANSLNLVKQNKLTDVKPTTRGTLESSSKNKEQSFPSGSAIDNAKKELLSELERVVKNSNTVEGVSQSKIKPPVVKSKPERSSGSQKMSQVLPKQESSQRQCSGKSKEFTPRHVSKSTFRVKTPVGERNRNGNQELTRPSSTIEIPVQYLSSKGHYLTTHEGAVGIHGQSDALTFQVQPVAADVHGPPEGPFIITSSPKPKRKVSKQVVQLSQLNDDESEQSTLRLEPQGRVQPQIAGEGVEHPICPHCHKKSVPPEERKRNVQVLQLQPVSDTELPPTPTTPTPQASITFEAPQPQPVRPARIIKVIPAGRQQLIMQRHPPEEPRSVHFRLNMGGPQAVPIRIGDYIRIPLNPGQARGVRVIFN